jgi:hypothetical protein
MVGGGGRRREGHPTKSESTLRYRVKETFCAIIWALLCATNRTSFFLVKDCVCIPSPRHAGKAYTFQVEETEA